jgi:hypothetical protein
MRGSGRRWRSPEFLLYSIVAGIIYVVHNPPAQSSVSALEFHGPVICLCLASSRPDTYSRLRPPVVPVCHATCSHLIYQSTSSRLDFWTYVPAMILFFGTILYRYECEDCGFDCTLVRLEIATSRHPGGPRHFSPFLPPFLYHSTNLSVRQPRTRALSQCRLPNYTTRRYISQSKLDLAMKMVFRRPRHTSECLRWH